MRLRHLPVALQRGAQGSVAESYERLQQLQFLTQPQCPAAGQTRVVILFGLHPGRLAEHVARIEYFEGIDETHGPRQSLLANRRVQRPRRRTMPAAGIEIYQLDGLHGGGILHTNYDRTVNLPSW